MAKKLNDLILAKLNKYDNQDGIIEEINGNIYDEHEQLLLTIGQILVKFNAAKVSSLKMNEIIISSIDEYKNSSSNFDEIIVNTGTIQSTADLVENNTNQLISLLGDSIVDLDLSDKIMKSTQNNSNNINNNIIDLEKSVNCLSKGAQEFIEFIESITALTKSVASIAEHTGLLSLNAAIEAARAGDSGRGFAVVAEQVKILASLTVGLTVEIDNITGKMVQVSEQVGDSVNDCILQLVDSVQKMSAIVTDIGNYSTIISEIKKSSKKSQISLSKKLLPKMNELLDLNNEIQARINQWKIQGLKDTVMVSAGLICKTDDVKDDTLGSNNGIIETNDGFEIL